MKKSHILILVVLFSSALSAQNSDEKKYLLTTNTTTFGLSTLSFLDPYLSPLTYNGLGIIYEHNNSRFLSIDNTRVSTQSKLNLEAGITLNPQYTSSMIYLGANYGWGLLYHFNSINGIQLQAGGSWDIDFGFKNVDRNINNPVNLDMATNLNIIGLAKYNVPLRKRTLKLQLAVESPILGCMFVPGIGASYYEMFELGNLNDAFHFSSLYNKRGLNAALTVEVPFKHSVWRFGFKTSNLKYSANDLVFKRNELSLLVGTIFDMASFAGKKHKAPKNFISTNE